MKQLVLVMFIYFSLPLFVHADASNDSLKSANVWIELVDKGDYSSSWKEAASYFKANVTQEAWKKAATGARQPLGKLISRRLKSNTRHTQLPGAPDGEYQVIVFDSVFENKKQAVEIITPMLEKDKKWRVSGYVIR